MKSWNPDTFHLFDFLESWKQYRNNPKCTISRQQINKIKVIKVLRWKSETGSWNGVLLSPTSVVIIFKTNNYFKEMNLLFWNTLTTKVYSTAPFLNTQWSKQLIIYDDKRWCSWSIYILIVLLVSIEYFMREFEMTKTLKSNYSGSGRQYGLAVFMQKVGENKLQFHYFTHVPIEGKREDRKSKVLVTSLRWKLRQMIYHVI